MGNEGGRFSDRVKNGYDTRNMNRDDAMRMVKNRKMQFNTKLHLENLRRQMSKGGEIITLMKERVEMSMVQQDITQMDVAGLLKEAGVRGQDVEGITFNPYRSGQVEIQFRVGYKVDLGRIEQAIGSKGMKIEVAPYDHLEEVIMIKGMPLTGDMKGIEEKIEEAVRPFVQEVKRIEPCKYRDGDEFFKNKYNGIWRVVVEPKNGSFVPNFIVVDRDAKVQGQVQYRKKYDERPEMCSDCYEEDHLRGAAECEGVVTWEEYCARFEERWLDEEKKRGGTQIRKSLLEQQRVKLQKLEDENAELHFRLEQKEQRDEPSETEENKEIIKKLQEEKSKLKEENEDLLNKCNKRMAPEKVKEMEEAMAKLQSDMKKHEAEDKKKDEEFEKLETELKVKEEEIKKYKEVIQIQLGGEECSRSKNEDTRKRENSQVVHDGNDAKNSRQSESIVKNDYQWNIPLQLPKKNSKVWICPKRGEDPKEAVVTAIKGKEVFVAMVNKKTSYDIDIKLHFWSLEKPLYNKTPDSSAILGVSASTPAHTPEEVKGGGILKLIGK